MMTWAGRLGSGIGAVTTKELRGRMRGWRAFASLTLYVAFLAAFVVLIYLAARHSGISVNTGSSTPFGSAAVGQTVFEVLMVLQPILVVFLAPAFTAGAISLEREKQTLELLVATPIPTLAIVIGKLVSALAFVLVQIVASIPLVAVVFVFGGVAPDDVLRAYAVLIAAGFGFGCVGLALSSITRRTQAATVLTWLSVLALTLGSAAVFFLWNRIATTSTDQSNGGIIAPVAAPTPAGPNLQGITTGSGVGVVPSEMPPSATPATAPALPQPPDWMLWLNPGVAMGDVMCGVTGNAYGWECLGVSFALGQDASIIQGAGGSGGGVVFKGGMAFNVQTGQVLTSSSTMPATGVRLVGPISAGDASSLALGAAVGSLVGSRDRFWPRMVAAWVVTGIVLVAFSVLMVRPRHERRLLSRLRSRLRLRRRKAEPEVAA